MADRGIGSGGALGWLWQRVTAVVLVPIVIAHLLTMHKWTGHGLPYDQVMARLGNPYWKVLEITFLTVALYHGLNGLYSIVQDYVRRPGWRLTIFGAACCVGLVLLAFGLITVFSIPRVGLRAGM